MLLVYLIVLLNIYLILFNENYINNVNIIFEYFMNINKNLLSNIYLMLFDDNNMNILSEYFVNIYKNLLLIEHIFIN